MRGEESTANSESTSPAIFERIWIGVGRYFLEFYANSYTGRNISAGCEEWRSKQLKMKKNA